MIWSINNFRIDNYEKMVGVVFVFINVVFGLGNIGVGIGFGVVE